MKIARFTDHQGTRLGLVEGDEIADVGTRDDTLPTDVGQLLADSGLGRLAALRPGAPMLPLSGVRLEAPLPSPPEFLAIGLNYGSHVAERDRDSTPATQPVVFNKQVSCITGPHDPIVIPRIAPTRVDYEGELGVVIGSRCRNVSEDGAADVVAGYLVVNDVSVRDWQRATPTITMGKSWDTHGPTGPWLVTSDEIPDPHSLRLRTWVDDELRQDDNTSNMIANCWALIAHLSSVFTLLPGMIIATGTPAGVGVSMEPLGVLHPGQKVSVEIDQVGTIANPVIAEPEPAGAR